MPSNRLVHTFRVALLLGAGFVALAADLSAQKEAPAPPSRVEATRAELEAIAAHPPKGMSSTDLKVVQQRLANGDFNVGSRVLIEVQGDTIYSDTFTVRTGSVLALPSLPPLSLQGVLRSESDSVIAQFLSKYLKNPEVRVTPLMRVGVLGGVTSPGYYDVPAQTLLSDIVMSAGGLGQFGDMKRTKINRGNVEIMDPKAVSVALSNGATLDLMNLQSGDNINVGVQNPQATLNKVQIITALLAIPLMIVSISAIAN
jgi:protein involved in polysaccharide export with SLBB domain